MEKTIDLQPWLEYFDMLRSYEQGGFLEISAEKHEAFITRAALYTLAGTEQSKKQDVFRGIADTVHRLCAYAGWKMAHQKGLSAFDANTVLNPETALPKIPTEQLLSYLKDNFAVHVVKEEQPHDLLYTLLLYRRRRWWSLWRKVDCIETIIYEDHEQQ